MVQQSFLLISTLGLTIELVVLGLLIFAYVLRGKKLLDEVSVPCMDKNGIEPGF
jgi:hypothetical protein